MSISDTDKKDWREEIREIMGHHMINPDQLIEIIEKAFIPKLDGKDLVIKELEETVTHLKENQSIQNRAIINHLHTIADLRKENEELKEEKLEALKNLNRQNYKTVAQSDRVKSLEEVIEIYKQADLENRMGQTSILSLEQMTQIDNLLNQKQ